MESQNHLIDGVDGGYLTEAIRAERNAMAETALEEVTGLMEYLWSPEALKNARKARERRLAERPNREPRTPTAEPNVNTNREP
jgi:hypothetical protein